jgi:hypothetical protein
VPLAFVPSAEIPHLCNPSLFDLMQIKLETERKHHHTNPGADNCIHPLNTLESAVLSVPVPAGDID